MVGFGFSFSPAGRRFNVPMAQSQMTLKVEEDSEGRKAVICLSGWGEGQRTIDNQGEIHGQA